ncbi:phage terminase small subunit [Streptomyces tanashiensis]
MRRDYPAVVTRQAGDRGPVPNREDDFARARSREGSGQPSVIKGEIEPVEIPKVDRDRHPIARRPWESLKSSGRADFYRNSDRAFAYSPCEDLSQLQEVGQAVGAAAPDDPLRLRTAPRRGRHRGTRPGSHYSGALTAVSPCQRRTLITNYTALRAT